MTPESLILASGGFLLGCILPGAVAYIFLCYARQQHRILVDTEAILDARDQQVKYLQGKCRTQREIIRQLQAQAREERRDLRVFYLPRPDRQNARNN